MRLEAGGTPEQTRLGLLYLRRRRKILTTVTVLDTSADDAQRSSERTK